MKIDKKMVEYIAILARLYFSKEEKEIFSEQLSKIVEYADKIKEVDTSKIKPTAHVVPLKNILREDEIQPSIDKKEAFKNTPEKEEFYFKVPKIV